MDLRLDDFEAIGKTHVARRRRRVVAQRQDLDGFTYVGRAVRDDVLRRPRFPIEHREVDGTITVTKDFLPKGTLPNMSIIRVAKILKPLRVITHIPQLRLIVIFILNVLPVLNIVLILGVIVFMCTRARERPATGAARVRGSAQRAPQARTPSAPEPAAGCAQ
mgnify:CR=1 FL=1